MWVDQLVDLPLGCTLLPRRDCVRFMHSSDRHTASHNLGFTLIELLVVVAIIGLLLSTIMLSLSHARMKARDTKRLSDIRQVKTGMDLYFNSGNGFPESTVWVPGQVLQCSGTVIMRIANDPSAPLYQYTYTAGGSSSSGCGSTVRSSYQLQFFMENKAAYYTMDPDGTIRDLSGTPVSIESLL